jgi:hypothetical protein
VDTAREPQPRHRCTLTAAGKGQLRPDLRPRRGVPPGTPLLICAPEEIRTPNLLIRSQMLYPLSYGRLFCCRPA